MGAKGKRQEPAGEDTVRRTAGGERIQGGPASDDKVDQGDIARDNANEVASSGVLATEG